jgi:hypothetical protein
MRIVAAGILALFLTLSGMSRLVNAQTAKAGWQADWEKILEPAKKEGKVVVSIPASAELRTAIEKSFEKRYGIDVEPIVGERRRSCARWSTKARLAFATSICTWAAASRS